MLEFYGKKSRVASNFSTKLWDQNCQKKKTVKTKRGRSNSKDTEGKKHYFFVFYGREVAVYVLFFS